MQAEQIVLLVVPAYMKSLILCIALIPLSVCGQDHLLLLGNNSPICLTTSDSVHILRTDTLPDTLTHYTAIFIFSNARSELTSSEIEALLQYTASGGGLYCGADNLPLQQEFNQVTKRMFEKEAWGNFSSRRAEVGEQSFLRALSSDSLDAGETTVAVPLDVNMRVEAWVDDQPLITSCRYGKGTMIFDGGYSRFYCPVSDENRLTLRLIINYLSSDHPD